MCFNREYRTEIGIFHFEPSFQPIREERVPLPNLGLVLAFVDSGEISIDSREFLNGNLNTAHIASASDHFPVRPKKPGFRSFERNRFQVDTCFSRSENDLFQIISLPGSVSFDTGSPVLSEVESDGGFPVRLAEIRKFSTSNHINTGIGGDRFTGNRFRSFLNNNRRFDRTGVNERFNRYATRFLRLNRFPAGSLPEFSGGNRPACFRFDRLNESVNLATGDNEPVGIVNQVSLMGSVEPATDQNGDGIREVRMIGDEENGTAGCASGFNGEHRAISFSGLTGQLTYNLIIGGTFETVYPSLGGVLPVLISRTGLTLSVQNDRPGANLLKEQVSRFRSEPNLGFVGAYILRLNRFDENVIVAAVNPGNGVSNVRRSPNRELLPLRNCQFVFHRRSFQPLPISNLSLG
jgi:hypothetical protein